MPNAVHVAGSPEPKERTKRKAAPRQNGAEAPRPNRSPDFRYSISYDLRPYDQVEKELKGRKPIDLKQRWSGELMLDVRRGRAAVELIGDADAATAHKIVTWAGGEDRIEAASDEDRAAFAEKHPDAAAFRNPWKRAALAYFLIRERPESLGLPKHPFSRADFAFANKWTFGRRVDHTQHNVEEYSERKRMRMEARAKLQKWGAINAGDPLPADVLGAIDRVRAAWVAWQRNHNRAFELAPGAYIVGPSAAARTSQRKRDRADSLRRRAHDGVEAAKKRLGKVIGRYSPRNRARVRLSDSDAAEKLAAKLAQREKEQELMKAANRIVRKKRLSELEKIAELTGLGLSEKVASKLLEPDFAGREGFASYQLKNNGAEIRRLRQRIEAAEKLAGIEAASYTFDGGEVEDDAEGGRVRIHYDGKPDAETRAKLKSRGFRWSRKNKAWQRVRTENAIAVALQLTGAKKDDAEDDAGDGYADWLLAVGEKLETSAPPAIAFGLAGIDPRELYAETPDVAEAAKRVRAALPARPAGMKPSGSGFRLEAGLPKSITNEDPREAAAKIRQEAERAEREGKAELAAKLHKRADYVDPAIGPAEEPDTETASEEKPKRTVNGRTFQAFKRATDAALEGEITARELEAFIGPRLVKAFNAGEDPKETARRMWAAFEYPDGRTFATMPELVAWLLEAGHIRPGGDEATIARSKGDSVRLFHAIRERIPGVTRQDKAFHVSAELVAADPAGERFDPFAVTTEEVGPKKINGRTLEDYRRTVEHELDANGRPIPTELETATGLSVETFWSEGRSPIDAAGKLWGAYADVSRQPAAEPEPEPDDEPEGDEGDVYRIIGQPKKKGPAVYLQERRQLDALRAGLMQAAMKGTDYAIVQGPGLPRNGLKIEAQTPSGPDAILALTPAEVRRRAGAPPTYGEALKAARKAGAKHASGYAHLAQTASVVAPANALTPAALYAGAVEQNLGGDEIRRLHAADPANVLDVALGTPLSLEQTTVAMGDGTPPARTPEPVATKPKPKRKQPKASPVKGIEMLFESARAEAFVYTEGKRAGQFAVVDKRGGIGGLTADTREDAIAFARFIDGGGYPSDWVPPSREPEPEPADDEPSDEEIRAFVPAIVAKLAEKQNGGADRAKVAEILALVVMLGETAGMDAGDLRASFDAKLEREAEPEAPAGPPAWWPDNLSELEPYAIAQTLIGAAKWTFDEIRVGDRMYASGKEAKSYTVATKYKGHLYAHLDDGKKPVGKGRRFEPHNVATYSRVPTAELRELATRHAPDDYGRWMRYRNGKPLIPETLPTGIVPTQHGDNGARTWASGRSKDGTETHLWGRLKDGDVWRLVNILPTDEEARAHGERWIADPKRYNRIEADKARARRPVETVGEYPVVATSERVIGTLDELRAAWAAAESVETFEELAEALTGRENAASRELVQRMGDWLPQDQLAIAIGSELEKALGLTSKTRWPKTDWLRPRMVVGLHIGMGDPVERDIEAPTWIWTDGHILIAGPGAEKMAMRVRSQFPKAKRDGLITHHGDLADVVKDDYPNWRAIWAVNLAEYGPAAWRQGWVGARLNTGLLFSDGRTQLAIKREKVGLLDRLLGAGTYTVHLQSKTRAAVVMQEGRQVALVMPLAPASFGMSTDGWPSPLYKPDAAGAARPATAPETPPVERAPEPAPVGAAGSYTAIQGSTEPHEGATIDAEDDGAIVLTVPKGMERYAKLKSHFVPGGSPRSGYRWASAYRNELRLEWADPAPWNLLALIEALDTWPELIRATPAGADRLNAVLAPAGFDWHDGAGLGLPTATVRTSKELADLYATQNGETVRRRKDGRPYAADARRMLSSVRAWLPAGSDVIEDLIRLAKDPDPDRLRMNMVYGNGKGAWTTGHQFVLGPAGDELAERYRKKYGEQHPPDVYGDFPSFDKILRKQIADSVPAEFVGIGLGAFEKGQRPYGMGVAAIRRKDTGQYVLLNAHYFLHTLAALRANGQDDAELHANTASSQAALWLPPKGRRVAYGKRWGLGVYALTMGIMYSVSPGGTIETRHGQPPGGYDRQNPAGILPLFAGRRDTRRQLAGPSYTLLPEGARLNGIALTPIASLTRLEVSRASDGATIEYADSSGRARIVWAPELRRALIVPGSRIRRARNPRARMEADPERRARVARARASFSEWEHTAPRGESWLLDVPASAVAAEDGGALVGTVERIYYSSTKRVQPGDRGEPHPYVHPFDKPLEVREHRFRDGGPPVLSIVDVTVDGRGFID